MPEYTFLAKGRQSAGRTESFKITVEADGANEAHLKARKVADERGYSPRNLDLHML